jgi:hypothetical protein
VTRKRERRPGQIGSTTYSGTCVIKNSSFWDLEETYLGVLADVSPTVADSPSASCVRGRECKEPQHLRLIVAREILDMNNLGTPEFASDVG